MTQTQTTPNLLRDGDRIVASANGALVYDLVCKGQVVPRMGANDRVLGFDVLVRWPDGAETWKFFGHNVRLTVERS